MYGSIGIFAECENLKVRTTLLGLDDARTNEVLQIV